MAQDAFGLASLYDPSIAVDQQQLARQMALAQAIRQQSLTPIDTSNRQIGGMGYAISPLEGVAKIVQAIAAQRLEGQADQERAGLSQRAMTALASILRDPSGAGDQRAAPVTEGEAPTAQSTPRLPSHSAPTVPNQNFLGANPGYEPLPQSPGSLDSGSMPSTSTATQASNAARRTVSGFPRGASLPPRLGMADLLRIGAAEMLGGQAGASAYAKNLEIPDAVKELYFTGQNPQEVGDLTTAKLRRDVTQPSTLGRNYYYDPATQQVKPLPVPIEGTVDIADPSSPAGYRSVPIPGATTSIAAAAQATELGKGAALPGQPLYDAKGNPLPLQSRSAQLYGSPSFITSQVPGAPTQIPPAVQRGRDDVRIKILTDELRKTNDPQDRAAIETELANTRGGQAYPTTGVQSGAAYPVQPLGTENAQKSLDTSWEAVKSASREANNTKSYLQNIVTAAQNGAVIGPQADRREMIAGLFQLAGIKEAVNSNAVTQTQLLNKYANQIVARLGQGGLGTDQARALLQSAYPNQHMNLDAIREAAANLSGAQDMANAKARFLLKPATKRDTADYQQREMAFDQAADPRIFQYLAIRDPAKRKAFAAQAIQQDPDFVERFNKLRAMGALQ